MAIAQLSNRGRVWMKALTGSEGQSASEVASVVHADAKLGGEDARFIAVVPDPNNRFPRVRKGEVGLEEGWTLAKLVRDTIAADAGKPEGQRRPLVAVVDVPSQAYGRKEELLGIHLACGAAADAYASARQAGHPVVALLVGRAISGAFLANGYQANRIIAFNDPGVLVHAMGKEAAARITRRSVAELDELGERVPPIAYDIRNYAKLGALYRLLDGIAADAPQSSDVETVRGVLEDAVTDIRKSGVRDLSNRLTSPEARETRAASIRVRELIAAQWDTNEGGSAISEV